MPRTTNRGINPHTHLLDDIVGIETISNPETFTFAPGTQTVGQSFGDWAELYASYSSAVAATPGKYRQIVFDPRGLPPGTPITVPAIAGVAVQSFEASTAFTSAGNPTNQIDVEIDPDVEVSGIPDFPGGDAIMTFRGLNLVRKAGAASPWATFPAGRSLKVILEDSRLADKSSPGLFHVLDGDVELQLINADFAKESGHVVRMSGAGRALRIRTQGAVKAERDTIKSDLILGDLDSSLSPETKPGPQSELPLPAGKPFSAPAASNNNRPALSLTVLAFSQFHLAGPTSKPQVLQAFPIKFSGLPVVGNTLNISSGSYVETYTFVVLRAAPFEVTIGASPVASMSNLASAINLDSVPWKSETISLPGGGGRAVAIIRKVQTSEGLSMGLADRAYGVFAPAVSASAGIYPRLSDGFVQLSYSAPTFVPLPAADPMIPFAGWSSVSALQDKTFVTVIDEDTSGTYEALNPFGPGLGSWKYVTDAIDPTFVIPPGGGSFFPTRQTRFVLATLGAADVTTCVAPATFAPGEILALYRTDVTAGALTVIPTAPDTTINGLPVLVIPGNIGFSFVRDGLGGWWTVGTFP